jgi:hypothetical protein
MYCFASRLMLSQRVTIQVCKVCYCRISTVSLFQRGFSHHPTKQEDSSHATKHEPWCSDAARKRQWCIEWGDAPDTELTWIRNSISMIRGEKGAFARMASSMVLPSHARSTWLVGLLASLDTHYHWSSGGGRSAIQINYSSSRQGCGGVCHAICVNIYSARQLSLSSRCDRNNYLSNYKLAMQVLYIVWP